MHLRKQEGRRLLHFLNHSLTEVPVKGIEVSIPVSSSRARAFYPDDDRRIRTRMRNNELSFTLRDLEVYELVVVEERQ